MANQKLKFGGAGLPEGKRTWYETKENGKVVVKSAAPGDEVDPKALLHPTPDYFVKSQMASLVGASTAKD